MLLAHKIELRPTPDQADYLARACGARRHCYKRPVRQVRLHGCRRREDG